MLNSYKKKFLPVGAFKIASDVQVIKLMNQIIFSSLASCLNFLTTLQMFFLSLFVCG